MKIRLFSLFLFAVMVLGCRCKVAETYSFMGTTERYFINFKEGDKWIYERVDDSIHLDTFVFVSKQRQHDYATTESDCDGDYYEIQTHSFIVRPGNDTLNGRARAVTQSDYYNLSGPLDGDGFYFYSPLIERSSEALQYQRENKIISHITYTIKGKSYPDVLEFRIGEGYLSFPEKAPVFFWAPKVGLIYFERYHNAKQKRVSYALINFIPA